MNIRNRLSYYLLLLAFPLFFILHGINGNFGLIDAGTAGRLLLYYLIVTGALAFLSKHVIKDYRNAFIASFILLLFFFFFGVFKDFARQYRWLNEATSYKIVLPVLFLLSLFVLIFLKRSARSFKRASSYLSLLVVIVLSVEFVMLVAGIVTNKEKKLDFGDTDNEIAKSVTTVVGATRPVVFWIVFDEYSGQTALKERWNYDNPVDSLLRGKGFFVADSATSNYNYTHYSLASTLDMCYLAGLPHHAEINFRDIMRGHYSLFNNNTTELLKKNGYDVENFAIYDIDGYPTKAKKDFPNGDFDLIDNQTLPGRIRQDIGWNIHTLFKGDKKRADSMLQVNSLKAIAEYRDQLLQETMSAAEKRKHDTVPVFFMFHYMYTHEAFLYDDDGNLSFNSGYGMAPDKYVASIKYANRIIARMVDSIKQMYSEKDLVIIIQGDHGYKYEEDDAFFDKESCSILYAVYCSDGDYSQWKNKISAVNSFRIFFNKYFRMTLPMLPDTCSNLYYR